MKCHWQKVGFAGVVGLCVLLGAASGLHAQTNSRFFSTPPPTGISGKVAHPLAVLACRGAAVRSISDVAFEGVLTTGFNFNPANGGGEGACFDPTPVLTTVVAIPQGFTCLNAHFSTIVGSQQTYGPAFAPLAVFQVTLTPLVAGGVPQHMIGHYDTPYGLACPAVALEAERDVDTFGSNFFQPIGTASGSIPPGNYRVDVWWAGAPPFGAGGALGAAFVLKLYGG
ncbi:MAG TPA: hypothetical protein VFE33_09310 [Thermoanaerobaculia bacterium]|nr:hypothetical protein [Thermoanaerobaculia bacterium]